MKKKRTALFHSAISLLLCVSMLVGTTFAWFTDSVSTGINTIAAGNLDVELYHSNAAVTNERVDSGTKLFMDLQGDPILWEPGVVSYENLRITNEGDLALAYQLAIATDKENYIVDPETGAQYGLSQILKVGFVENGITATDRAGVVASVKETDWTTLANFLRNGSLFPEGNGESEKTWGVVVYWEPGDNDNRWNLNNGKTLNEGDVLSIDLGIRLIATQEVYESDSFGNDYDTEAKAFTFPNFVGGSASATIDVNDQGQTVADVTMVAGKINVLVPAGVQVKAGVTELSMSVSELNASDANISLGENEDKLSLDVHIEGLAEDNTVPIIVTLAEVAPTGLNMGNYKLYHVESTGTKEMTLVDSAADFTAHNQFKYFPATGDIVLYMATFSEVTVVANTVNPWNGDVASTFAGGEGTAEKPYIIANADQLAHFSQVVSTENTEYGSASYKLISDINLNGEEAESKDDKDLMFYPVGYWAPSEGTNSAGENTWYTYGGSFKGVFDGNGHTIDNIYQNTWLMDGNYDNGYWKEAMGIFGYVDGGTVKNLTVSNFSSDGEFTPTGVISAYARAATFESIAITNCNPRVYNTGNGGIVGIGGSTTDTEEDKLTFNNITIDNTNKISALWGSWDVACGGLVGMFRGAGHVYMINCHMAAQIDVYNDVCGNYQYYWYRYAGMMVGTNKNMVTDKDGYTVPEMTKFHADNCTVHFGDWNDYYYCELVANSLASYTHDHQFSRLTKVDALPESASGTAHYYVEKADGTIECRHFINGVRHDHDQADSTNGNEAYEIVNGNRVLKEDKQRVHLPFNQLFTGYGWGVKHIPIYDGTNLNELYPELDITILDKENTEKFEKNDALSDNYIYRVGNQNEFPVGKLFQESGKGIVVDSGVHVSVTPMLEGVSMEGTFVQKTNWEDSTLRITGGTGLAKLTIQDYNSCKPFELIVEVVDAYNDDPSKATESDVVLLSDISSGGFTVSNKHTFYGNGFKVTCAGKGTYLNHGGMTRGYVNVESGGVLDNAQVVCDIYPQAFVYTSEVKVSSNLDEEASTSDKSRYMYQLSAVALSGDGSSVSNCYVYGGRNNIYVGGGNVRIENTVTECGTLANIQIKSTDEYTVVLKDVVTNQYQTKSTYDTSKTMLGFGILVGDNESASNPTLSIQNSLTQYNWVTKADTNISNDYAKQAIDAALEVAAYKHTHNGETTVNTGVIYLNNKTAKIDDQRTNHGYLLNSVQMSMKDPNTGLSGTVNAQVYSLGANSGNYETNEDDYNATVQGDVLPTIVFNLGTQAVEGEDRYLKGDISGIEARFEKGQEAFNLDITKLLTATKHGFDLSVTATCLDSNGNGLSATNGVVTLDKTGTYTLKFTVEDDIFFTSTGELLEKSVSRVHTVPLTLTVAEPAIADATIEISKNAWTGEYTNASSDGSKNLTFKLLENVSVTDAGTKFDLKGNGGTAEITYSKTTNGYGDAFNGVTTIKVTYTDGQVLTMKLQKVSGNAPGNPKSITYDVSSGTVKSSNQLAKNSCTDQQWQVYEYSFKGLNGKTITNDTVVTINVAKDTSGGGCVTPDTLVTLADGTQKRIDALTGDEILLAWDFYKGEYTVAPLGAVINHGYKQVNEVTMRFADGSTIKTIDGHGFYDVAENKFVIIDENNIEEYIDHKFVKYDGKGNETITLVDYCVESTYNEAWTLVTAVHFDCVLNGLLTLSPTDFADSPAYLMPFEIGEGMKYDEAKMQADIAKYGQYTYDDFAEYCTYEQFVGFAFANWKVAVSKGYINFEDILYLLETYVNN